MIEVVAMRDDMPCGCQDLTDRNSRRWIFTSELDTIEVCGDPDAYVTLVDDALEDAYPSLFGYQDVCYCKVRDIPRRRAFVRARRKCMFTKRDSRMDYLMGEGLRNEFPDVAYNAFARQKEDMNFFPPPPDIGYTKENVSEYLDLVNSRNGHKWEMKL